MPKRRWRRCAAWSRASSAKTSGRSVRCRVEAIAGRRLVDTGAGTGAENVMPQPRVRPVIVKTPGPAHLPPLRTACPAKAYFRTTPVAEGLVILGRENYVTLPPRSSLSISPIKAVGGSRSSD